MNKTIENLIFKKLTEAGYESKTAKNIISYLIDASNNQLDDKEYAEFLDVILGDSK
jgi:hypothetical protein